jgi:hypothetical protein
VAGGVDVREELFQFFIRLENAFLGHVLDRLYWPDAFPSRLFIDRLRAGFRRLSRIACVSRYGKIQIADEIAGAAGASPKAGAGLVVSCGFVG